MVTQDSVRGIGKDDANDEGEKELRCKEKNSACARKRGGATLKKYSS